MTRTVNILIGHACFVACPGCYNYFNKNPDFLTEDLFYSLKMLKELFGVSRVTFAGGDPLSRDAIIEILEMTKKLGYSITLDTVGTAMLRDAQLVMNSKRVVPYISPSVIAPLVDVLGLPVDGSTNEICRLFRKGRPAILDETMALLEEFDRLQKKISINTVVHKQNIDDISNILPLLQGLPAVTRWELFQFMPIGPLGFRNRVQYEISDHEYDQAVSQLSEPTGRIEIVTKNRASRKHRYLYISADGLIWTHQKSKGSDRWIEAADSHDSRITWGSITDRTHLSKIFTSAFEYSGDLP